MVRGWMEDASAGHCLFPVEELQECHLEDAAGNSIPFREVYQKGVDKKTIIMFGRNLLCNFSSASDLEGVA